MAILLLCAGTALATADSGVAAAGLKIGTLGAGLDVTAALVPSVNLRTAFNYATWKHTVTLDDAEVEGRLRWQTIPLLLDWHPRRGKFRISGGVIFNGNRVDLSVTPHETVELSGEDYVLESLDGRIRFSDTVPYLGVGYGNPVSLTSRWHASMDLGVMFQGRAKVSAQAVAAHPMLQDEVDRALREEVDSLENDLSSFRLYPVISVGFSRRF